MFDKAMLLLAAAFHSTWDTPTRRQSLRSRHPLRNVPFRCVLLASLLYNRVYCKFFIFCDPTVLHEIARRKKRAASFCHDFIKLKIVLKNKNQEFKIQEGCFSPFYAYQCLAFNSQSFVISIKVT